MLMPLNILWIDPLREARLRRSVRIADPLVVAARSADRHIVHCRLVD